MTVTSRGWLVGTAAVVDLEAACALYGRESLPGPLGRSRPVGSVWLLSRDTGPIENRLNGGDLHAAREWVQAVLRTEASLACRVSFTDADTPDVRVHALRTGESGYVAVQRIAADGIDMVDIVEVAPHALGLAVAESVGLVGAGGRIRIAVTGGGRLPAPPETVEEYDDFGFLIPSAEPRDTALQLIDGRELVAVGVVQSTRTAGGTATRIGKLCNGFRSPVTVTTSIRPAGWGMPSRWISTCCGPASIGRSPGERAFAFGQRHSSLNLC